MALSIDGGLRRRLSLMSVVDTARGSRRIAREDRQDQAGGSPRNRGIFNPKMLRGALLPALRKLDPRQLMRNPVMFVVEVTAALVTVVFASDLLGLSKAAAGEVGRGTGFELQIAIWLWFTVYFATYAEALAEARGKAQAASLRKTRSETLAHRRCDDGTFEDVGSSLLRAGDVIVVREGETIAGDGDVIAGVAYVNEAVITGESAAVLKEPGTDIRSSVTGGTTITSDTLTICITANPGETFLDRMIALVEGAKRQRTPNEIALSILLSGLTIVFLLATATLRPFGLYSGAPLGIVVLVALLVCLIPTTIGGLLSAIGIAGMDRVARFNVLAMSGRAVEAAGDVDVLLLDKTGTITFGNRLASRIVALPGVAEREVLDAALLTSLEDETPEGRSVVELAKARLSDLDAAVSGSGVKAAPSKSAAAATPSVATLVPFSAESRTSGVILTDGTVVLKGAVDAIVAALDAEAPAELQTLADEISSLGATPLAIRRNGRPLGVIELKDTVKPGLKARFDELRRMGIRTIMVTGDNPLTAKTIAAEAGVDDYMAQAKPEDKIARIRAEQADGHLVAMTGDGTKRCSRRSSGRRGTRHEQRHFRLQGSGQHGRPRLRPDEAHRSNRHRQAAVDHARRDHHVLDRQRRGQVLCHPAGHVHGRLPRTKQSQHHAPGEPPERHPLRGHLQRAGHHRPRAAFSPRRGLSRRPGCGVAAKEPPDLWGRRNLRPIHRHQADRPPHHSHSPGLRSSRCEPSSKLSSGRRWRYC